MRRQPRGRESRASKRPYSRSAAAAQCTGCYLHSANACPSCCANHFSPSLDNTVADSRLLAGGHWTGVGVRCQTVESSMGGTGPAGRVWDFHIPVTSRSTIQTLAAHSRIPSRPRTAPTIGLGQGQQFTKRRGYELGHGRSTPAREGFDYSNSRLQGIDLNALEEEVRRRLRIP